MAVAKAGRLNGIWAESDASRADLVHPVSSTPRAGSSPAGSLFDAEGMPDPARATAPLHAHRRARKRIQPPQRERPRGRRRSGRASIGLGENSAAMQHSIETLTSRTAEPLAMLSQSPWPSLLCAVCFLWFHFVLKTKEQKQKKPT